MVWPSNNRPWRRSWSLRLGQSSGNLTLVLDDPFCAGEGLHDILDTNVSILRLEFLLRMKFVDLHCGLSSEHGSAVRSSEKAGEQMLEGARVNLDCKCDIQLSQTAKTELNRHEDLNKPIKGKRLVELVISQNKLLVGALVDIRALRCCLVAWAFPKQA